MSKPTLYLMLGYPGAGKTTVAKVIHELTGAVHLWADKERRNRFGSPTYTTQESHQLYHDLNNRVAELLEKGDSVVFDTNFNFFKDREKMRQLATSLGAECKLIWVQTPREVAHERATTLDTSHHTRVLGHMPSSEFNRMAGNLQSPQENETYIVLDGTKITPVYVKQKLKL